MRAEAKNIVLRKPDEPSRTIEGGIIAPTTPLHYYEVIVHVYDPRFITFTDDPEPSTFQEQQVKMENTIINAVELMLTNPEAYPDKRTYVAYQRHLELPTATTPGPQERALD